MKYSIIFDLDGTMTNSEGIYQKLKYDVLADMGHKLSEAEKQHFEKTLYYDFPQAYKEKFNKSLNEFEFYHLVNTRVRQSYQTNVKLKKGFLEFLDYLDKEGIKYSIATAAKNINVVTILKRFNIFDRFEHIVSTTDVGRSKKFPTIYKVAAILMKTKFENTIVFEDSLSAIATAKKAGFKVVGVYDEESKDLKDEVLKASDYFINSFEELMREIESNKFSLKSIVDQSE